MGSGCLALRREEVEEKVGDQLAPRCLSTPYDEGVFETSDLQRRRRFVASVVAFVLVAVGALFSIRHVSLSAVSATPTTTSTTLKAHHGTSPVRSRLGTGVFATPAAVTALGRCPMTLRPVPVHHVAARHCTVLSMGDSLGIELGWGLQSEFANAPWITLEEVGKVSTGLSNSWFYNWPQELQHFLVQYHPNVVVAFLGANDVRNIYANNQLALFGSAAWHRAYGKLVLQLVRETRAAHATLVWVGLPIMQPTPYGQGIHAINATVASALRGQPGTAFINTEPVLATPTGAFQSSGVVNGVVQTLRSGDGIHMSPVGENVVATYVDQQLALLLHVGLTPALSEVLHP